MATCQNCHGPHTTWQCPEVRALLFAPARFACNHCGKQIDHDGLCLDCLRFTSDERIAIGLPIKQDNGEYEYPGYIDGALIGFYATRHHADLALRNIIAREMPATIGAEVLDLDFAPVGWPI